MFAYFLHHRLPLTFPINFATSILTVAYPVPFLLPWRPTGPSSVSCLIFILHKWPFRLLTCPCLIYADSLKLCFAISSPMACLFLQSSLVTLVHYCSVNDGSNLHVFPLSTFSFDGFFLSNRNCTEDLRATFDNILGFSTQRLKVTNRAGKLSGFIKTILNTLMNSWKDAHDIN